VYFAPIGIVDIVILPLGETLGRSFFVCIVLDSCDKNFARIPDPNPEQGHFLYLDNDRPHLADHEI
jgi:hypothetical protein